MNRDKQLVGAAGEHLVLSRLLAKGILASQAPRGARKADILVNPLDGGRPIIKPLSCFIHKYIPSGRRKAP